MKVHYYSSVKAKASLARHDSYIERLTAQLAREVEMRPAIESIVTEALAREAAGLPVDVTVDEVTKPQDLPADADDWQKFAAACWECGSLVPRVDNFFCAPCLVAYKSYSSQASAMLLQPKQS